MHSKYTPIYNALKLASLSHNVLFVHSVAIHAFTI